MKARQRGGGNLVVPHRTGVTAKAAERFDRDGFVILEQAFDPAFIDTLCEEYRRQFPAIAEAPDAVVVGERRFHVTMRLEGPFLSPDFYANPEVLKVAASALGEDFLIDNFGIVTALPHAPDQRVHTDHPDLYPDHPFARAAIRPYALTVAIPLIDLTPETGATKLFSGSHNRFWKVEEFGLPYIRRGDCYLVDYRLSHQGTENRTAAERPIIYVIYSRAWFIDVNNFGNNVRIKIASEDMSAIPQEHRPLFRRLAAKGAFDRTVDELFGSAEAR